MLLFIGIFVFYVLPAFVILVLAFREKRKLKYKLTIKDLLALLFISLCPLINIYFIIDTLDSRGYFDKELF